MTHTYIIPSSLLLTPPPSSAQNPSSMIRKRANLIHDHHHHHHPHGDKRENIHHHKQDQEQEQLIPGLPDHVAHLILSQIPPLILYSVCHSWRRLIYSPLFPPFLSLYALLTPPHDSEGVGPTTIVFSSFDPISSRWVPLPPPPVHLLSRHPSFISRHLPIQAVAARGSLVVVAATSLDLLPALPRPLIFDPLASSWGYGATLPVPRRWCAAGALDGSMYVASGVGSHFSTDTARSVERWDPWGVGCWDRASPLKNARFSREAVCAVGWRGKLCMVNAAAKEGVVYDPVKDEWEDMAEGMVDGWRGPVAAMDEEVVYVVDEWKGVLRRYEEERDCWVDVLEEERLRGAHQMAVGGGRICVVCGGGGGSQGIVVVDVAATPVRMWVVEPPAGFKAVAVHILPRMSMLDFQLLPSTPI